MVRYKITTIHGVYKSIGYPVDAKKNLVDDAREMLATGTIFQMEMEDNVTFIIGPKLLEDCQFQIEEYE